jgi:hypothetical protein
MRPGYLYAGLATSLCLAAAVAVLGTAHHPRSGSAAPEIVPPAPVAAVAPAPAAVVPAAPAPAKVAAAPASPRTSATAPRGTAGMVVAIDPETGELGMPSAQQLEELHAQGMPSEDLNYSDAGLTPVVHPNGMVSLDLQGRFQEYATIHVGPDGRKIVGCGDR